jgi:murein DD-endopeptidase MepM/ murein hydrolase activator NlpD
MRTGDSVHVLVERARGPQDITRPGRVLAARLFVGGRPMEAFCFPDDAARASCPKYYDSTGRSLATAFLRAPLQFRWISSRFGNRFHPVLRTWRAHQGVDYSANTGTPVRAVGDGTVRRALYSGGYGNVVDIQHPNGWVTRYAHLSRFAPRARGGARVLQGDVIGYVGATGLATGPHLHFEVLVQGTHRNPADVFARVDGTPLPAADRLHFDRTRDILLAMLDGSPRVFRADTP